MPGRKALRAGPPPDQTFASVPCDLALGAEGDERSDRLVALLSTLRFHPLACASGAVDRAVRAARLGRRTEAYALSVECLGRGACHARIFFVLGACELDMGDRPNARRHFALVMRMARTRPELREERRGAQRLLADLAFGRARRLARAGIVNNGGQE